MWTGDRDVCGSDRIAIQQDADSAFGVYGESCEDSAKEPTLH